MSKHINDQHTTVKSKEQIAKFVKKHTCEPRIIFIKADLGPSVDEYDSAGDLFYDSEEEEVYAFSFSVSELRLQIFYIIH